MKTNKKIIKDGGHDKLIVYKENNKIYKSHIKTLIDNEFWCLKKLEKYGFVPKCKRINQNTIEMDYIKEIPLIEDKNHLKKYIEFILITLRNNNIRHGDLTKYSVIPHYDKIYIIDWSESRLVCDPRPDKRIGGDRYWLYKTISEISGKNISCDYNSRAKKIWNIINKEINFNNKSVVDMGCGYGDLLWRYIGWGAEKVFAIDKDISKSKHRFFYYPNILFLEGDIENINFSWNKKSNIYICMSVLPYIKNLHMIMSLIRNCSDEAIFEIQTNDDCSVGLLHKEFINNNSIYNFLLRYYNNVINLGYTNVKDNKFKRIIWRCYND